MTTKTLTMTDARASKLAIAAAAYTLSAEEFMLAALDAALVTCAESDGRLALMFGRIDSHEHGRKPELVAA